MVSSQLRIKTVKMIDEIDWSNFVSEVYGRPYDFQQQEGCQSRGIYILRVPYEDDLDYFEERYPDTVPEIVNGEEMGPVKFEKWLERDPKQTFMVEKTEWNPEGVSEPHEIGLWWNRNFYPSINAVAADLCKRGLLEEGEYIININW